MDYEEMERQTKEIMKTNETYLKLFKDSLKKAGLSDKVIRNHVDNVKFYLNDYLNYEEPTEMPDGTFMISDYLGYWFIRKCMWSTPSSIKSTAASLKKFYKLMVELGYVEKEAYTEMCEIIKEEMDEWVSTCREYNDPDGGDPFMENFLF